MPDDLTTLAARESQPDEAREKSRLIAAFRAGVDEQPEPVANDRPAIGELVIDDIRARMDVGRERYGTVLQAFNRRDALTDAYHEAIDLTKYIRQEIAERDERDAVHEAMREALKPFAEAFLKSIHANHRMDGIGDTDPVVFRQWLDENTIVPKGTNVGHYRRAADALARAAELDAKGRCEVSDKPTVECGKCGFRYGACHIDLTQTPEDGCANCECEAKDVRIATLESRVREVEATLASRTESLEAALASRAVMESERDTLRAECDRLREFVPMTESRLRELLGPFYPDDAEDAEDVLRQANADPQEGKEWLPRYKAALSLLAMECGYLTGVIDGMRGNTTSKFIYERLSRAIVIADKYWQAHLRLVADEPAAALVARLGAE